MAQLSRWRLLGPALFIKCLTAEELFTLRLQLDIAYTIYLLTVGTQILPPFIKSGLMIYKEIMLTCVTTISRLNEFKSERLSSRILKYFLLTELPKPVAP